MQTLVINLAIATERRSFQESQLSALGLPYEVVDAVDRDQVGAVLGDIRDDAWERVLMPTELACFASHHRVWQRVAESEAPVLVLEDDVLLSPRVASLLDAVKGLQGVDHLSLETRLRNKLLGPVQSLVEDMGMARMYQDRTGAAAYVLWPSGAAHLLQRAKEQGAALADAFIANDYALRSYQAVPPMVIQSDVAKYYGIANPLPTPSYIQAHGPREAHQAGGVLRWRMKLRRLSSQLSQAGRWLQTIGLAKRVRLAPDPRGFVISEEPVAP